MTQHAVFLVSLLQCGRCRSVFGRRESWQIKKAPVRIEDHFVDLADPRRRPVTYPLVNIVTSAICAVKPAQFEKRLLSLASAFREITGGQVVAVDDKTLRRSFGMAITQ